MNNEEIREAVRDTMAQYDLFRIRWFNKYDTAEGFDAWFSTQLTFK